MQFKNFIGIDVSKLHLDLFLINGENVSKYVGQCKNDITSIESFLNKLFKTKKLEVDQTLICAEHTGIYCKPLIHGAANLSLCLWVENPRVIKQSSGVSRGKSDAVDAARIAEYAKRYADKVMLYEKDASDHEELATLSHARESLITTYNQLQVQIKEAEKFDPFKAELLKSSYEQPLNTIKKQIKDLDKLINSTIRNNQEIKKSMELITTIPGIGRQNALAMILATRNFALFENAGQMACFAGVAPFVHESGSSIRGKTRVSHFARKDLKKLLHMAALAAIRYNPDLKAYFIRKVSEGKNKMSVINALRNKLIHRIFAVIKRGTPYTPIFNGEFSVSPENPNLILAS